MLNQKSLLMSVAVLSVFALTFSGCGKSKETKGDVRGGNGQNDAQTLEDGFDSGDKNADGLTQSNNGLTPLPKEGTTVGELNDGTNSVDTLKPLPKEGSSGSSNSGNQGSSKGSKAVAAQFKETEAVKTGGKTGDLNFTSAGDDGLMTLFRAYGKKVSAEQQKMNQNLANAIVSAKLKRSGDAMTVDLTLDESLNGVKKITAYKLTATTASNRFILKQVSSSGDLEYQGGFLKCIDKDGGCNTAYMKIKMSGAYTRIIFRKSAADNFFVMQQGASSQGFDLLKSYLMNTVNFAQTNQKISGAEVSSFEVVNGRSAMNAVITAADNEKIGLSIALLAQDSGTEVSSQVSKTSESTQKLSSGIKSVSLINNNGKGDIRLVLDMSGSTQAVMWLTLSALPKATLTIAEIEGFDSKIPAF